MGFGWIFTHLLTIAGVCVGWLNPFFGLMVYTGFAVLRPTYLWFWSFDPHDPPRLSLYIAGSTLLGWAINGLGGRNPLAGVRLPMFGLLLYLLAGVVAWKFAAINPGRAWEALSVQMKIGVMAMVTLSLVQSERQIRTFAWVILLSLGYLAFEFNSQYILDGWNRIYWDGFGGVDNNGTAMIMVMGVPLAFYMGIFASNWWVRGLCLLMTACLVHVVLFSFSRGGQLGLCIVGMMLFMVALLKLPRKGLTITLTIVFVLLALRLAGPEVRDRFMSIFADEGERDTSAASRFVTWGGAWQCMVENPLGVGPRNFNLISHRYGLDGNKSVHNLFLQTGADYGFLGLAGLFIFYVSTMLKTFAMAGSAAAGKLGWPRYFGHMVCIALGGFLVCSMFIGMESVEIGFLIALLGLCTVAHVARREQAQADERNETKAKARAMSGMPAPHGEGRPIMGTRGHGKGSQEVHYP